MSNDLLFCPYIVIKSIIMLMQILTKLFFGSMNPITCRYVGAEFRPIFLYNVTLILSSFIIIFIYIK